MKIISISLLVALIAGCITYPTPDALATSWREARRLDISQVGEEARIQLVLTNKKTATLLLRDTPLTSVGIEYQDEQRPSEEIEHTILDVVGAGRIQEVRISTDKRFIFVTASVDAQAGGRTMPMYTTVMEVFDLTQRRHLDSIDVEDVKQLR